MGGPRRLAADVAIVGSGATALLLADRLADRARVVLIGDAAPAPSLGIVAVGPAESPARLADVLGVAVAEEILRFSAESVRRLLDRAAVFGVRCERRGSLRLAVDPVEAADVDASIDVWRRAGVGVSDCQQRAFLRAVQVEGDGVIDALAFAGALRGVLTGRVLQLPADRLGDVDATIVAFGGGWAELGAFPALAPCLLPVRITHGEAELEGRSGLPCLARYRHEAWVANGGRLRFAGCRWAVQPEMEAGETDTAVRPAVAAAQQAFVARRLGDAHDWTFRAGIEAFSCDGLPLLGPMPGRPELLVACGWDGWELSWASAAADALAGVILDGRASVPTALQARRMV